jgi:hypothetical protein
MTTPERLIEMPVGEPHSAKDRFPMSLFEPHERQAERNHYQSLQTLARRGGLSWCEALAIIEDRDWSADPDAEVKFRARANTKRSDGDGE